LKICPSCSTQNNDLAKFCSSCGKNLFYEATCPHCNKEIKPNDTFCPNCGKSLKEIHAQKPKKKLSKLKKTLIGIASFIGFLALLYLSLFLYGRFYIDKNFEFAYMPDGSIDVIDKKVIPELSFGDLTICSRIDSNTNAPVNAVNEFEIGAREIYATIHIAGAKLNDSFKFVWKYADTKNTIIEYSNNYLTGIYYFEGYKYSFIAIPESDSITNYKVFCEPGDYIVEFYHNDSFIDSTTFSIVKATPVFSNHVISSLMDTKTLAPIEPKDSYNNSTEELFSAIFVSGYVEKDDNFRFALKDKASGSIIKENQANYFDLIQNNLLDQYLYFYIIGPYSDTEISLDAGDYIMEFYHNGTLASQADFSISGPQVTFGDLETGKYYNEDDSVVDPTDTFILGNKMICASIKVEGAASTDKWKYVYKTADRQEIIKEFEDYYYPAEGEPYYNGYSALNLYIPSGMSIEGVDIFGYPGRYLVEYYHNGSLIDSKEFEVIDSGINFGELVISESVASNDSPINPQDEFSYGTEKLCATIEINGADLSDNLRFLWKDSDNNILRDMSFKYSDNWTKQGNKYNGYFAILIGLSQDTKLEDHDILGKEGTYYVEFFHDGYLMSTKSFNIVKE